MDESEKLMALKKAYADIILNTAKESAARIMVSERKSIRFQQELLTTKEEALRMLVRLKNVLDTKVREAEMVSLNQQKKIEELEAQLEEAEDIVRDLRAELQEVQDELKRVTTSIVQPHEEQNLASNNSSSEGIQPLLSPQLKPTTTHNVDLTCGITNGELHMDNSYSCNSDFASIVLRSKEPELYRNGCTQRIRAFERSVLDEKTSFTFPAKKDDVKLGTFIKGDEEGEKMCITLVPKDNNTCAVEKAPVIESFKRTRQRAARYKKRKSPSSGSFSREAMDTHKTPVLKDDSNNTEVPVVNFCRPRRKGAAKYKKRKSHSSKSFLGATNCAEIRLVDNTCQMPAFSSEINQDAIQKDLVFPLDLKASEEAKENTQLESPDATENDTAFVKPCNSPNAITDDAEPVRESDVKHSGLDDGVPSQHVNNRCIKYTFQRKNKKEPLKISNVKSPMLDEHSLETTMEEIQKGGLDSQKSSLILESSRDNRRLAQVARQLISLSEKKWWQ